MFTCSKVIRGPTRFGKALNLIFPKLSSQNVRGFDQVTILSPSFHGLSKERLTQLPPFVYKIRRKTLGSTSRKVGWGCASPFLKPLPCFRKKSVIFPYLHPPYLPISDPIKKLVPYFRPEALEPEAWPESVTSLRAVSLFSLSVKQNARHTQMTTRVTEGARSTRLAALPLNARARVHSPY